MISSEITSQAQQLGINQVIARYLVAQIPDLDVSQQFTILIEIKEKRVDLLIYAHSLGKDGLRIELTEIYDHLNESQTRYLQSFTSGQV